MKKKIRLDFWNRDPALKDLAIFGAVAFFILFLAWALDAVLVISEWFYKNPRPFFVEAIIFLVVVTTASIIFAIRRQLDIREARNEKRIAERRLNRSRAQLQAVLDGVPDIILQTDTGLRIVWANKAALDVNPDAIGARPSGAFPQIGEEIIDNYCRWAMDSKRIERGINYKPATRSNRESYYESIGAPLTSSENEVFGAISIVRDVTDRMRVEHTWNLLSSIVESTDDAIYGMSFDGKILSWNRGAEAAYGYTAEEIPGKTINHIAPFELRREMLDVIERVIRKQEIERFETERIRKDGKRITVSATICPFVDVTGKKIGVSAIDRDITDKKKSEEALKESEARFRQMAETIVDVFWLIDIIKDKILFVSPAFEKIWGMPKEALYADRNVWLKSIHREDKKRVNSALENLGDSDGYDEEYRVTRPDGSIRWVHERAYAVRDSEGSIYRAVGISRDITQQKRAQAALSASETRFRQLFEHMGGGVAVFIPLETGEDFLVKDFNRGGEIIDKISKKKVIGKKASFLFESTGTSEMLEVIKTVLKTGKTINRTATTVSDGEIVGWRNYSVYKLPSGEVVAIYEDVTETKKAEEALRKSEEKYRTLVSTAPDGIALADPEGNIIESNEALSKMLGYGKERLIGMNLADQLPIDEFKDQTKDFVTRVAGRVKQPPKELIARRRVGSELPVEITAASLLDLYDNVSGLIAVIRDVSDRKKFEDELKKSREQLRDLALHLQTAREEERKQLAFEIHDELGYLLTAIKLDLSWLMKKIDTNDPALKEKSKAMSDLIETTIQKVRSISHQIRPSILDHFGLVAAIEWQTKEFQKRTAVRCRADIKIEDVKFKDPFSTAIFRIYQEALTNIARHAKASRVDVHLYPENKGMTLIVKDNGVGMEEEKIKSHKSFGLLGTRERAKFLGGKVSFKSKIGEGTVVELKIPDISEFIS